MESVFLLSLVYPEKPENSVAKATELEYVKKNTKKKDGGIQMEKVTLFSHILPEEQERMLDAIQTQEDKTQEKLKEKQGVVVRGKKNW